MNRVKINNGIEGNIQNFGAMSIGTGSQAQQTVTAAEPPRTIEELRQQVEQLAEAIQAQSASLANAQRLLDQTAQARAELARPRPDRSRVSSLLESVTTGVASVAGLAKAAGILKAAVVALL